MSKRFKQDRSHSKTDGKKGSIKVINDSVHGLMKFDEVCTAIIDTPQFQRLRFLKQLGVGYYVYPGASHNRFEHCLGVCHLAGKFIEELKAKTEDGLITDSDVKCVKVAGLCHDLGHGPWSHVFDNHFIKTVRSNKPAWKHEDASEGLFNCIWEENKQVKSLITADEKEIIMAMIRGEAKNDQQRTAQREGKVVKKDFLFEIVANNVTKFDVDKWDYFLRDCHYLGMSSSFDYNRIINFSAVIDGHIAVRDKEAFNMYEMFHTRHVLHRRAYQHKTVQAVEIMLVQALQEAEHFIKIPVLDKDGVTVREYKISECIDNMSAYTNLTDSLYHDIKNHQAVGDQKAHIVKAQSILKDLENRRLYKMVCESSPLKPECVGFSKTTDTIKEEIMALLARKEDLELANKDCFVVKIADFDLGSNKNNPLKQLKFFRKNENMEPTLLKPEEVSALISSNVFCEKLVRVFLRPHDDGRDRERRTELQDAFRQWQSANLENRDPEKTPTTPI